MLRLTSVPLFLCLALYEDNSTSLNDLLWEGDNLEVKIKRLSPKDEEPVVFTLKSLGYSRAAELKRMDNPEQPLFILLEGVVSPNLKDQRLLDHYGAATPAELLKKMLLPDEIDDLCREVEKLSGYRRAVLEEIKKK